MILRMPPVADPHKGQSAGGQNHREVHASPVRQNLFHVQDRPGSSADLEEPACDPPHHSSEESGGNHIQPHLIALPENADRENAPYGVLHGGIEFFRVTTKIVATDQPSGCRPHCGKIQRAPVIEGVSGSKRIASTELKPIAIEPVDGAEPAVEILPRDTGTPYGDVRRKGPVQGPHPPLGRDRYARIEMAHLSFGVRPAIGAARSYDLAILARDPANSFCQCALDCSQSSLRGPAAKIGSVVSNDEF